MTVSHDLIKVFEEAFHRKPYSLIAIYLSLLDDQTLTVAEKKHLIDKAIQDFSPAYYSRFKYSSNFNKLIEAMAAYEAKGSTQKASVVKLREALHKLDLKIAEVPSLKSPQDLSQAEIDIF